MKVELELTQEQIKEIQDISCKIQGYFKEVDISDLCNVCLDLNSEEEFCSRRDLTHYFDQSEMVDVVMSEYFYFKVLKETKLTLKEWISSIKEEYGIDEISIELV